MCSNLSSGVKWAGPYGTNILWLGHYACEANMICLNFLQCMAFELQTPSLAQHRPGSMLCPGLSQTRPILCRALKGTVHLTPLALSMLLKIKIKMGQNSNAQPTGTWQMLKASILA